MSGRDLERPTDVFGFRQANIRARRRACLLCTTMLLLGGCASQAVRGRADTAPYWPTEGWQTSTPERQGVDSEKLAEALDYVRKEDIDLDSLLIVRHGYLVLDAYFHPYSPSIAHDVASVTKSITASLVGIALDKGYMKSMDQAVLDFFPQRVVANLDRDKRAMTVKHLVTMSSGLRCSGRGEPELLAMIESRDWVQFALDLPMKAPPGTEFAYCSPGMHLLSAIIGRASGIGASEFAATHLFAPLGITEFTWPSDPQGLARGWGDLRLHPRDMAKIGYLYLHGGWWDGRRILAPDWVASATRRQTRVPNGDADYGYGWWIVRAYPGLFEARGRGGQFISVWPEKDLVVVWTGSAADRSKLAELLSAALKDEAPLAENPPSVARLQEKVKDAMSAALPNPVTPLPATAQRISTRRYRLDDNSFRIGGLSLAFPGAAEARLTLVMPDGTFVLPVGLDGNYRTSTTSPTGFPAAVKGHWQAERDFIAEFKDVGGPNRFRINLSFEPERVTVRLDDLTGLFQSETFAGRAAE